MRSVKPGLQERTGWKKLYAQKGKYSILVEFGENLNSTSDLVVCTFRAGRTLNRETVCIFMELC